MRRRRRRRTRGGCRPRRRSGSAARVLLGHDPRDAERLHLLVGVRCRRRASPHRRSPSLGRPARSSMTSQVRGARPMTAPSSASSCSSGTSTSHRLGGSTGSARGPRPRGPPSSARAMPSATLGEHDAVALRIATLTMADDDCDRSPSAPPPATAARTTWRSTSRTTSATMTTGGPEETRRMGRLIGSCRPSLRCGVVRFVVAGMARSREAAASGGGRRRAVATAASPPSPEVSSAACSVTRGTPSMSAFGTRNGCRGTAAAVAR